MKNCVAEAHEKVMLERISIFLRLWKKGFYQLNATINTILSDHCRQVGLRAENEDGAHKLSEEEAIEDRLNLVH